MRSVQFLALLFALLDSNAQTPIANNQVANLPALLGDQAEDTCNKKRPHSQTTNYSLGSIRAGQSTVIPCLLRAEHYPLATQVCEEFKAKLDQPLRFGVL